MPPAERIIFFCQARPDPEKLCWRALCLPLCHLLQMKKRLKSRRFIPLPDFCPPALRLSCNGLSALHTTAPVQSRWWAEDAIRSREKFLWLTAVFYFWTNFRNSPVWCWKLYANHWKTAPSPFPARKAHWLSLPVLLWSPAKTPARADTTATRTNNAFARPRKSRITRKKSADRCWIELIYTLKCPELILIIYQKKNYPNRPRP